MTKTTPTTDLDTSRKLLSEMGFEHLPLVLPELLERSVREKLTQVDFLNLALRAEHDFREERRVRTSLRISGLPPGKTLESFDFPFQRGIQRDRIVSFRQHCTTPPGSFGRHQYMARPTRARRRIANVRVVPVALGSNFQQGPIS